MRRSSTPCAGIRRRRPKVYCSWRRTTGTRCIEPLLLAAWAGLSRIDRPKFSCIFRKDGVIPTRTRQTARAALARLGERQALQWFRQGLNAADLQRIHETIQLISQEGLILLWPDLDRLADADDLDVAHHAREALERLSEDLDGRRN